MTPEDTVLEAAKILTDAVTANSKSTDSEQMELLNQLAKVFKKIAEKTAQELADKQLKKIA